MSILKTKKPSPVIFRDRVYVARKVKIAGKNLKVVNGRVSVTDKSVINALESHNDFKRED